MHFTADGAHIVTEWWPTLFLWESGTGSPVAALRNSGHAWDAAGKTLGVIAGDAMVEVEGEVRLWDVGRRQFRGGALPKEGRCLAVQPDGHLLATGGERTVELWDLTTAKPVGPPLDHPSPLISLSFSRDGRRLVTCGDDDAARVWEVPAPVRGTAEQVRVWVEILTGKELDEAGAARNLEGPELEKRRRGLEKISGLAERGGDLGSGERPAN
jgi:WD40 repeat protein